MPKNTSSHTILRTQLWPAIREGFVEGYRSILPFAKLKVYYALWGAGSLFSLAFAAFLLTPPEQPISMGWVGFFSVMAAVLIWDCYRIPCNPYQASFWFKNWMIVTSVLWGSLPVFNRTYEGYIDWAEIGLITPLVLASIVHLSMDGYRWMTTLFQAYKERSAHLRQLQKEAVESTDLKPREKEWFSRLITLFQVFLKQGA